MNQSAASSGANMYPWLPLVDSACAFRLLLDITSSWGLYLVLTSTILALLYYITLPVNWCRDLSEVGYDYLLDGGVSAAQRRGKSRRDLVREVRHLRKVGQLPPVYPNGWFVLLESNNLKRGEVKHVSALGQNFAVFRTGKGEVHVLDAYCPHLGANMGIGGAVRGDCLQCPFHGWMFSGVDGKCTSVPYSDKAPNFAHVKKWNSIEVNTFIFVWYHAEDEEPTWWPEAINEIEEKKWVFRGRNEFIINSHIQEVPENGGDVAHLSSVHGPSLLNGSDLRFNNPLWRFTHHEWDARWDANEQPGKTHTATMHLKHEIRFFNKLAIVGMDVRAEQIGPAYVELNIKTSVGNMIILQCITPLEPMLQKVIHRLYCPRHLYLYATIAMWGESLMFERDVMVWNHKTYVEKPLLVKEDRNIARHRRWYGQFYSEHSPRFSFQQETLEW